MPRPIAFVDTSALLALANRDDALYETARQVNTRLKTSGYDLVTSDWILTELLGGASRVGLRQAGCAIVRRLQQSRRTTIIPATHSDWLRAFDLYSSRSDKEWSLVDCLSILICEDRGIREVFTHDRHFAQTGLVVLMR